MSKRSKQESFLLGLVVGAIASVGIIVPLILLAVFGGDDADNGSAQPAPVTTTTTTAAPVPRGRGGPPEGRGPGSGFGLSSADPTSDGIAGQEVLAAFDKGGCANCHTIKGIVGATATVGPNLSEIGFIAAERRPGSSAEAYIEESIVDPNAFIAPRCPNGPCPSGVMLQTFADVLTESDLATVVGYLAALGTDAEAAILGEPVEQVSLDAGRPAESVLEPFMALPADPAPDNEIALGRYLFFDPRLSNNNSLSCASCHQPANAFTDGQALSDGFPSTAYFRNTPTVYNTAFGNTLYWDGRMDAADVPTLVRDHISEAHFMAADGRLVVERMNQVPAYVALFDEVYGAEPSYGRILNSVAAYVNSLNSSESAYDLFAAGDTDAISDGAAAGYDLFTGDAGCSSCHVAPLFSDEGFYNLGINTDPAIFDDPELGLTWRRFFRTLGLPNYRNVFDDPGNFALTLDDADLGAFNTPSLREVSRTAPYMHNGSLATLRDVVDFYNAGGGDGNTAGLSPLGLTDDEIDQLVAFLETLSSDPVDVIPPDLPGYSLVPLGGGQGE
ncbi:MAG: cytochrome c peroxidase [Actinomycetota bacterium]|nr:cytochrome c peroxidase [Actinomycetota bacterium]